MPASLPTCSVFRLCVYTNEFCVGLDCLKKIKLDFCIKRKKFFIIFLVCKRRHVLILLRHVLYIYRRSQERHALL